jgi:hypothetical protein
MPIFTMANKPEFNKKAPGWGYQGHKRAVQLMAGTTILWIEPKKWLLQNIYHNVACQGAL